MSDPSWLSTFKSSPCLTSAVTPGQTLLTSETTRMRRFGHRAGKGSNPALDNGSKRHFAIDARSMQLQARSGRVPGLFVDGRRREQNQRSLLKHLQGCGESFVWYCCP